MSAIHLPSFTRVCVVRLAHGSRSGSGDQVLLHADGVPGDQAVGDRKDRRGAAVILHHHDGLRAGKVLVKLQEIFHVGAAPGVDGLVRIPHDEKVPVPAAEHLHQPVLQGVDVLELIDHDVFEALLPLQPDLLVDLEDVKCEVDEVVVVEAEAFLLLVQIAVKQNVLHIHRVKVLLAEDVEGHGDHVAVILRLLDALADLEHVPRVFEGHVAQGEAALLVDLCEHGVDVGVVEDEEAVGVLYRVAVLLQHRHAEAVEGVDVAGVAVVDQRADALAHLVRGAVREGHAEDVVRRNADHVHQVREAVRKGAGLSGSCAGNDPERSFCSSDRFPLCVVQFLIQGPRPLPYCSQYSITLSSKCEHMFRNYFARYPVENPLPE